MVHRRTISLPVEFLSMALLEPKKVNVAIAAVGGSILVDKIVECGGSITHTNPKRSHKRSQSSVLYCKGGNGFNNSNNIHTSLQKDMNTGKTTHFERHHNALKTHMHFTQQASSNETPNTADNFFQSPFLNSKINNDFEGNSINLVLGALTVNNTTEHSNALRSTKCSSGSEENKDMDQKNKNTTFNSSTLKDLSILAYDKSIPFALPSLSTNNIAIETSPKTPAAASITQPSSNNNKMKFPKIKFSEKEDLLFPAFVACNRIPFETFAIESSISSKSRNQNVTLGSFRMKPRSEYNFHSSFPDCLYLPSLGPMD